MLFSRQEMHLLRFLLFFLGHIWNFTQFFHLRKDFSLLMDNSEYE